MVKGTKKNSFDWDAIEKYYCLDWTLSALSDKFGPGRATISKRAKRKGWVKDKTAEINTKTKAALVNGNSNGNSNGNTPTPEDIEVQVATNVSIILGHQKRIETGWEIVKKLEAQLLEVVDGKEELEESIKGDQKGGSKQCAKMLRAIALPGNIKALKEMTDIYKTLIPLERQATGIDQLPPPDSQADSLLETLMQNCDQGGLPKR